MIAIACLSIFGLPELLDTQISTGWKSRVILKVQDTLITPLYNRHRWESILWAECPIQFISPAVGFGVFGNGPGGGTSSGIGLGIFLGVPENTGAPWSTSIPREVTSSRLREIKNHLVDHCLLRFYSLMIDLAEQNPMAVYEVELNTNQGQQLHNGQLDSAECFVARLNQSKQLYI